MNALVKVWRRRLILGALAGLAAYALWPQPALRHPPGVLVPEEPEQRAIPARTLAQIEGYQITAVASYALQARVLHTKHYWDLAELVPYDVALGWGPMSDQAVLDELEVSQGNRFFFYEWRNVPPIPLNEIVCHAANNHLIAANAQVAAVIRKLRAGQLVKLRGYLVNVTRADGFHWFTSQTRTDNGNGACEVFYVETAQAANDVI